MTEFERSVRPVFDKHTCELFSNWVGEIKTKAQSVPGVSVGPLDTKLKKIVVSFCC